MLEISIHRGSRDLLDPLFSEADDSPSEIAGYKNLGDVLVAVEHGQLIGHVQIVETSEPEVFEIKSIAVREGRRSQGIGGKLVAAALALCRKSDARLIRVATAAASTEALKFYQRHGFRFQRIIRDFYVPERGYRPTEVNGIALRDEVILDLVT